MAKTVERRQLYVYADWQGLTQGAQLMGILSAVPVRGKEVFSFSYAPQWLALPQAQVLDPALQLFGGPQYLPEDQPDFGLFLDSAPDRWGRLLMRRREAALARQQRQRAEQVLATPPTTSLLNRRTP
jgi:serine/threonine-protein kinase HipA